MTRSSQLSAQLLKTAEVRISNSALVYERCSNLPLWELRLPGRLFFIFKSDSFFRKSLSYIDVLIPHMETLSTSCSHNRNEEIL